MKIVKDIGKDIDGNQYISIVYKNSDDKLHRTNGPAIIYLKNNQIIYKEYWQHDELHRLNGPAIIKKVNCSVGYYIKGEGLTKDEFLKKTIPYRRIKKLRKVLK